MSVRVHAIAKEVNKTSKELIQILTERGYDIKSASSTIDKITAQSIIDEFTLDLQREPRIIIAKTSSGKSFEEPVVPAETSKKAPIVRSKAEIEEEKRLKEEEAKKLKAKKKKGRACFRGISFY